VAGLFARADARNTNGRVYPARILRREVRRFRASHVRRGTALGELNHPSYYSAWFRSLNLPNVSHQVLELRWRGRELWGTIEVLPTPAGLLLSELYSKVCGRQQRWAGRVSEQVCGCGCGCGCGWHAAAAATRVVVRGGCRVRHKRQRAAADRSRHDTASTPPRHHCSPTTRASSWV
jgi:hypothetical protein